MSFSTLLQGADGIIIKIVAFKRGWEGGLNGLGLDAYGFLF